MGASPKLAGRYAKSILLLAKEKGQLDKVYADMQLIDDSVTASRDLALMLKSPIILGDKKESILDEIFGSKISDMTSTFIKLLVRKGREKELGEVAASFVAQYNTLNHKVKATLTTAVPVDQSVVDKVKKLLLEIDGNESVEIATEIDPEVLGGFVLHYGDRLLDASVQRKLQLIKKSIQDTSFINKI